VRGFGNAPLLNVRITLLLWQQLHGFDAGWGLKRKRPALMRAF